MNAAERTRIETLAGRLVDAEGAITSAQETLARVLDAEIVDEEPAATEPEAGDWITVRPDDERLVAGSRVRVGTTEAEVFCQPGPWLCLRAPRLDVHRVDVRLDVHRLDGPDVELWVPAEVTLPLPTEPGPFWGRVERDGETYVGWVLHAPGVHFVNAYCTPVWFGRFWHPTKDVTRLPIPDDVREALR